MDSSPFLGAATPFVYIEGSREEGERLFAGRFPPLPAGDLTEAGELVYYVQNHPQLQPLVQKYLTRLFEDISPEISKPGVRSTSDEAESQYGDLLRSTLVNSLLQDRRIGLVNLFWLAHSKQVAETIEALASRREMRRVRFSVHPLLARFYREVWRQACREVDQKKPGQLRFALGDSVRSALVDAIIDDQLPLAVRKIGDLDFETVLRGNVRYRITQEVFYEIYRLLIEEIESRVASGDSLFMAKLAGHMPSLEPESYSLPAHRVKMLFNPEIRRHLLTDQWRVGEKLRAAKQLAAEAKQGARPLSLLEVFDELATAVQRFELVSRVRERVHLVSSVMSDDQMQEDYGSVRIYRFAEAVEVVGNAVNATVLFLDLRGFTETSEGLVSERDLTHQVYTVFDPFVEVIARFGGVVDKFLGDGMMVTFGAAHSSRHGPLLAVRAAIVLQEKLQDLRDRGETHFTMGISIHYGRVYLAHFIGSAGGQDATVIGRNVNLAGRLSSGAKQRKKEEKISAFPIGQPDLIVSVGGDGTLANEGIAVSRETVLAIEKLVPLTPREDVEELYGEFYDTKLERKILLRYAGDAKFKGVWGSFPVYSVELG